MSALFAFTCSCCGQRHEGSPGFGYKAPACYDQLSEEDRQSIAELSEDLCRIEYPEGTACFARVVLEIPIHGVSEPFLWGVWVSLSRESFEKYSSTLGCQDESDCYFGWFGNRLPYYPDTMNLKTHVRPRGGGLRPVLELQPSEHPLAIHFHEGLTVEEAQQIAEAATHCSR